MISTRLVGVGLALALALGAGDALAGPWVPAPGHFYLELRQELGTTADGFDPGGAHRTLTTYAGDGRIVPSRLYDAQSVLYAEIGIATRLAVVADFVFLRSLSLTRAGEQARHALGVGDLRAGLRLVLLDEEVSCALEARLGVPTGRSDGELPLGPGDLRGELALSFGRSFDRVPFFIAGELGARLRSSGTQRAPGTAVPTTIDYSSELTYALDVGYEARAGKRLRLTPRVTLDGRYGLKAPTTDAPAAAMLDPLQPMSVRFIRVGAALGFGIIVTRSQRPSSSSGISRVDLQLAGGAFVWGQGLPALGDVELSLGVSR